MSNNNTFLSFQALDSSRFKKNREPEKNTKKPLPAPVKVPTTNAAEESALFLDAVSGHIDVSLKKSPAGKKLSPRKKEKKSAISLPPAALPSQPLSPPLSAPEPVLAEKPAEVLPEETRLFAEAMEGVAPVRAGGRDLAPQSRALPRVPDIPPRSMEDIFNGGLQFSLEYSEEFIQGYVLGTDNAVIGKLRAGAFSPEGHLDLHGQNLEQAYAALVAFIKHAYQSGKRHLLVITGRGRNSPGGTPVLRERVQTWFTREPFKRVIIAFCTAKPGDGGAGALYLLLRRRKKSQGKIVWDKKPSEEELLL